MAFAAGSRLGSFEIIAPLGAGGMGEVYRARDTRLNRDVAIKVLSTHLASDPAAIARFEREAQAVAALSHQNILAIHDVGTANGVAYAVMELLDGETLRARLANGALPTRRALDYAGQIVHGIAAAHGRGIVHRDLKPENVFITKSGEVKILDFGLAKTAEPAAMAATAQVTGATTPGTVMGTVGYMSPEQVRGQAIDHRTDIFSFGTVLYEMLTGRRAFAGDSQVETMNAILKEDPPEFADVNPALPSSLDRIVRRCIEKDPADRFHSAHDLGIALEAMSGASNQSSSKIAAAPPARRSRRFAPMAAAPIGALIIAAGGFAGGRWFTPGTANTAPQFQRLTFRQGQVTTARLAADGATIVYSALWNGASKQLFSTRTDSPESLALPYAGADVVSISSKGELAIVSNRRTIRAYAKPGTLARAPLSGGASRDVLEDVQDADWLPDGSNLVVTHFVNDQYQLEFPIGKVVYQTGGWISDPRVSPDGRYVAFLDHPVMGDDRGAAKIVDAAGSVRKISPDYESSSGLAWSRTGAVEVWFAAAERGSARALRAATLDGHIRTVLRVPGTLSLEDVGADGNVLLAHDNGRRGIVGLGPGSAEPRDLSWLDWTQPVALSSDGGTLLITEEGDGGGPGYSVYLRRMDGSPAVRLGGGEALALSADGKWVIAQRLNPEPAQLVLLPTGAGESRDLTNDGITHLLADFTPDGRRFVFVGFEPGKAPRAWIQAVSGGPAKPITPEDLSVAGALPSPDGRKVLVRTADGVRRLYPIDGGAPEILKVFQPADGVIRFASDANTVLVANRPGDGSVQVFRLDLTTGARAPVRAILPIRGSGAIGQLFMTPDGSSYVFGYGITLSDLYLAKALR